MSSNTIIQILKDHGIFHFIESDRIMAIESINPKGGDEYRDVTEFSKAQLYDFLGYE